MSRRTRVENYLEELYDEEDALLEERDRLRKKLKDLDPTSQEYKKVHDELRVNTADRKDINRIIIETEKELDRVSDLTSTIAGVTKDILGFGSKAILAFSITKFVSDSKKEDENGCPGRSSMNARSEGMRLFGNLLK